MAQDFDVDVVERRARQPHVHAGRGAPFGAVAYAMQTDARKVHALAGDSAAVRGQRGLIASDVISELRGWVNP